ncbi:hypothetical protein KIN20_019870 [Parelaphostrongylus tenuis]|uniref:Uncharacterized protein n=1 Tax=Parelaphostrongylus tenuis TaxID=148309 RepID=A0AAD5MQ67_PARTN|nr:hypothetical protein KIN20_019870 [Parelaphostrongylus tenuis]
MDGISGADSDTLIRKHSSRSSPSSALLLSRGDTMMYGRRRPIVHMHEDIRRLIQCPSSDVHFPTAKREATHLCAHTSNAFARATEKVTFSVSLLVRKTSALAVSPFPQPVMLKLSVTQSAE